LTFEDVEIEC